MASDESIRLSLLKRLSRVEEEFSLQRFNPLKVGGRADFYTEATTTIELVTAVSVALELNLPYLVIGSGTHSIFSDSGFPGLIIANRTSSLAYDAERSQVVVDSGLSLASLILQVAGRGMGGLVPFYGEPGSIGSAVYRNQPEGGRNLSSLVRYLTVLTPPTKMKPEPTIARYRGEWLSRPQGKSRLQEGRAAATLFAPHPVLLTVTLQLTSNRTDELSYRLQQQLSQVPRQYERRLGPLFTLPDSQDVEALLRSLPPDLTRHSSVSLDRRHPNYLVSRGVTTASQVREFIEEVKNQVQNSHGVTLQSRFEYLGVW